MSTTPDFIEYLRDQLAEAGDVSFRKMFGEYAAYLNGKVIGLVCSDQLFVKPTEAGRAILGTPTEAPPYSGARLYFLIENLDDREAMAELLQATAAELPLPRPKPSRKSKG